MATLQELRHERIAKLESLKALGVDPHPADVVRDLSLGELRSRFEEFEGKEVTVVGRITSLRSHGLLMFADIKDAAGKFQLYIKNENLTSVDYTKSELSFKDLHLLDRGDFVEARGKVCRTARGEDSLEVSRLRLLSKALRPLPDTWFGLEDKETRLRRRYLDTNINPEVYERFLRRAKFWEVHRDFFKQKGFVEINIPVLEHTPGGADSKPFITHMDDLDQDFYLRISQELFLKRLIGGGYERVYEIGPRFRNEGLSDEHLPEHMAMEFYWAYASWQEGMKLVQELVSTVLAGVYAGQQVFQIRGHTVDFGKDWERIDFAQVVKEVYGIDVFATSLEEVDKVLKERHIETTLGENLNRKIDKLWKAYRVQIAGPAFLVNHPKFLSPLAKADPQDPSRVQRFQIIIAGSELGNGWSELNDPQDQLARFREQQALREAGDKEAQMLDIDYVEMLEYGMPPTFGYGHSERLFWFLEDVSAREGVPFPQMKFELDESTKSIYGLK